MVRIFLNLIQFFLGVSGLLLLWIAIVPAQVESALVKLDAQITGVPVSLAASTHCVTFQLAELAVPRQLFDSSLQRIGRLRAPSVVSP